MTTDTRRTWRAICLGLAVPAMQMAAAPAMAAETLKIGAPESISGDWAPYTAAHGLRCMAELVNEAGEYQIELLVKDSKSEPQLAIALAQQMLDDEVIAVSGTPASDSLIPIGQLAAEYGAITFSAMNTQVEMFAAGLDNFVTVAVPDPHNAAATAKGAYDQGARSVVLFVSDVVGTWTRALPGWFGEVFERQGGKVLGSIEYPGFGITDWSPFISKLKAMDPAPDAIHISSINPDVGVLIRQLRAAGLSTMVLGSDGFDDVTLASVAANVDGTVFFAAHGFPTEGGALATFQADCAKRGYEINGAFFGLGGDVIKLMVGAARAAGSTEPKAMLEAIHTKGPFEIVTAPSVSYDNPWHYPIKEVPVMGFKDGKPILVSSTIPADVPHFKK